MRLTIAIEVDMSGPRTGPEHADRIDDGEFEAAFLNHEIPGRALGERLRLGVGADAAHAQIGPARLVEWRGLLLVTVADGGEGRGQHRPPNAGRARGLQHPQRPVAGGNDELVLVLRHAEWKGRGDVQHEVAAGDRLRPAGVAQKIGGGE